MTSRAAVQRSSSNAGFSLIEIIVALAIMTLLVGAAVPVISVMMERQKREETRKELNTLQEGIMGYFRDTWTLPKNLNELLENTSKVAGWVGPYVNLPLSTNSATLPVITKDAWNRDYKVAHKGDSTLEILSAGPNGKFGDTDDIPLTVDVTPVRREETLEELAVINTAVTAYNQVFLKTDPLPTTWRIALRKLQQRGYLPSGDKTLETDGWGSYYVPDPPGKMPVVKISSPNLESGKSGLKGYPGKGKGKGRWK